MSTYVRSSIDDKHVQKNQDRYKIQNKIFIEMQRQKYFRNVFDFAYQ